MSTITAAARASAASPSTDWERIGKTLQSRLGIDLNLRKEMLKDAILDYEDANAGNNLVGTKCYEFLRHVQSIVWKELDALRAKDPAEYEAWKRGERGATWPLKTNNVAHASLLKLSENRRFRMSMPGESSGGDQDAPQERDLDNLRRTTFNWRRKTTATWTYQDGRTEKGFPFFESWDRFDRHGNPDPKGRGWLVGHVNLLWIFGPEWPMNEKQKNAGNQAFSEQQPEKFSAIPRYQNLPSDKSEKKEDRRQSAMPTTVLSVSAEMPTASPKPAHPQQQTGFAVDQSKSEGNNFASGGAATDGCAAGSDPAENPAMIRALHLWAMLLRLVYAPLFGAGRIRFSQADAYERTDFKPFMQRKCVELLAENLHAARKDGEITLDEAATRLTAAIEAQAKYLKDNPEAWITVPDRFLRTGKAHGTLLSAMQHFVRETERPLLSPEPPENETFKQRRERLWQRFNSFGGTTTIGRFHGWCKQHGFDHIQDCLNEMGRRIAINRTKGMLPGKEFQKNKGGASAYFSSLLSRPPKPHSIEEKELENRIILKKSLWAKAYNYDTQNPHSLTQEQRDHKQQLAALAQRLGQEPEYRNEIVEITKKYFGMTALNISWENLALIHFIQNQQIK